jgi:hypothetical protein
LSLPPTTSPMFTFAGAPRGWLQDLQQQMEIEEEFVMPASSKHAALSGGFTIRVSHQLANTG